MLAGQEGEEEEECAPEQMPGAAPDGSGLGTKGEEPEGRRTEKWRTSSSCKGSEMEGQNRIPIWKLPRGLLRRLCSVSRETWNKPLENTLQPKKKWSAVWVPGLDCGFGIQGLDLLRCGALSACLSLPVFVNRKMRVIMALFLRAGVRRINRKRRAQCPVHRVPKMLIIITDNYHPLKKPGPAPLSLKTRFLDRDMSLIAGILCIPFSVSFFSGLYVS